MLQVQANVQTVLEGLGLVDNKSAKQDSAALKEVCFDVICSGLVVRECSLHQLGVDPPLVAAR